MPLTDSETSFMGEADASYDSAAEYLYMGLMEGCGCGRGQDIAVDCWMTLKAVAQRSMSVLVGDRYHELILSNLERLDLIEHGSVSTASWLTPKGEKLCRDLGIEIVALENGQ